MNADAFVWANPVVGSCEIAFAAAVMRASGAKGARSGQTRDGFAAVLDKNMTRTFVHDGIFL
jgi:hypothetical protein